MDREHKLYKDALSGMMPDFEKVRLNAKCGKPVQGRTGFRRWAMPALSAACAAGLICALVLPVRASLVNLFYGDSGASTAAYLNTPQFERPEVENVDVQAVAPAPWQVRTYEDTELSWGSSIQSALVSEAIYDSGTSELTLKYCVDGSVFGLEYGVDLAMQLVHNDPAEGISTFPCILDAQLIENAEALVSLENIAENEYETSPNITHMAKNTIYDSVDGVVTLTSVFDLPQSAAGNDLVLMIPCVTAHPIKDNDNTGLDYEHLGYIEIPFRIDNAVSHSKTAAGGTYMVNGAPVDITEAVLSPTALLIRFAVPDGALIENFDFNIYADGELLTPGTGAERVSYLDYRMGDSASPTIDGLIRVPFADTEISEVKLIACDLATGEAITGDEIELIFE